MRHTLLALSPTAMSIYEQNREEFYLKYLADKSPPKLQQTKPMSVGASFDAYIKSFLHVSLFGKGHDPRFEFEAIFENQVEPQNRDWARKAGFHAYSSYQESKAVLDMLTDLQAADGTPRFEFEIRGEVHGIPFVGKPDVYFRNKFGSAIILDWKVNGYCGNSPLSPKPGYVMVRDGWKGEPSKIRNVSHKHAFVGPYKGVSINLAQHLESIDAGWAQQLAIYGWLLGEPVGGDYVVAIDQLACSPDKPDKPKIRIAEFRSRIGKEFQTKVIQSAAVLWEIIRSDHFFREMTKEDSIVRTNQLDVQWESFVGDDEFTRITRG